MKSGNCYADKLQQYSIMYCRLCNAPAAAAHLIGGNQTANDWMGSTVSVPVQMHATRTLQAVNVCVLLFHITLLILAQIKSPYPCKNVEKLDSNHNYSCNTQQR